MTATERLRAILARETATAAAPIFDPLSARIADMEGWEVVKLSGSFGKFANLAVPDGVPLANMSDLVDVAFRIRRVCEAPLIVDADEGGGNAITLARTVREVEAAGASAIEIEDNLVPRTFGEAERRHALMLPAEEQVGKLKAAVAARRDPRTVIVARTSALTEFPRAEALERIRAYSATGAEAIMLPDLPEDPEALVEAAGVTHLPLTVLGLAPHLAADAAYIEAARIRILFQPHLPYRAAVAAIAAAYAHLKAGGGMGDSDGPLAPDALLRRLDRTAEFQRWQDEYVR